MRGVVSEGVNTIRDEAIANANEIGLGSTGPTLTPSGKMHTRRGRIPDGIYSFVAPNEGSKVAGHVAFQKNRDNYHAFFLEFGTVRMAPQPFFMRALPEGKGDAIAAMKERFDEAVGRMLK